MANPQLSLFGKVPFAFADRFLQDHAGQIISEPRTAILELIANSYDAGATKIVITWPTEKGEKFSVTDKGIGMNKEEFERRWKTLCYDRVAEQGTAVVFPKGVRGIKRTAFGRSGKGRYQTMLRKAHQRTFNLQQRLQEVQPAITSDSDINEVLRVDAQKPLFEEKPES